MRYGNGQRKSRGSQGRVIGTAAATVGIVVASNMMQEDALAQGVPGIALQDADVRMLGNGNALVTYEGAQFAVPAGQFTQFNGVLVVSLPVAQVFAPQAVLNQRKILDGSVASAPSLSSPRASLENKGAAESLPVSNARPASWVDVNAPGVVTAPTVEAPPVNVAAAVALSPTAAGDTIGPSAHRSLGELARGEPVEVGYPLAKAQDLPSAQEKAKEASSISYEALTQSDGVALIQTSAPAPYTAGSNDFMGVDAGIIGSVAAVGAVGAGAYFVYQNFFKSGDETSTSSTENTSSTTSTSTTTSGDVTAPTISSGTSATINEGYSLGALVLDVDATDNAGGVGLSSASDAYKIVSGNTGGAFTIDKDSGEITVANVSALDVDASSGLIKDFVLGLEVQDANGNKTTQSVTISVNNLAVTSSGMKAVNLEAIYDAHRKSDVSLGDNANWFTLSQDKGLDGNTASDDVVLSMNATDGTEDAMVAMIYEDVAALASDTRKYDTRYQGVGDANLRSEKVLASFVTQKDGTDSDFTESIFTDNTSADADFTWGWQSGGSAVAVVKTAMAVSTGLDGDTSADTWDISGDNVDITLAKSGAGTLTINGGAKNLYYDIGDADASGAMNELYIMDSSGILNTYRIDLGLNLFKAGTAWDGLDLNDLADGKIDGLHKGTVTAKSFLWLGGTDATSATDDQLIVVASDGMAYIYGADF